MDVIYMSNVFPRKQQIVDVLKDKYRPSAEDIDVFRIPLFNLKSILDGSSDMFCFSVLNTNDNTEYTLQQYKQSYKKITNDEFEGEVISKLTYNKDDKMSIQNQYYRYLTLCDNKETQIKKYLVFMNKILIESVISYETITSKQSNDASNAWRRSSYKTLE